MENITTPRAVTPTRLNLIARGGCASPAYLDVERTLACATRLFERDDTVRRAPIAALRGLASRLSAHAEQTFRDHVQEVPTALPAGLTVSLPTWSSDYARLTYRLLLTYARQAEDRIAMLARAARA